MRKIIVMLMLCSLFSFPAQANNIIKTSRVNATDIRKAETCLNSIKTIKSRFIQTAQDGAQVAGTFWLQRPGKMRFEYDKPITDFILADGMFVYYYDGAMKEQSNMPINQSLATFFLRAQLNLSGDISVTDIQKENDSMLITVVQKKDPAAGSLTLELSQDKCELKKWRILDPQGATTEIALFETKVGIPIDSNLFKYYPPDHTKSRYNR